MTSDKIRSVMTLVANIAAAVVPVLAFLALLLLLDSYRLVSLRTVAVALAAGMVSAVSAVGVSRFVLAAAGVSTPTLTRFIAPALEESIKAVSVVLMVRRGRTGFLVDTAIVGFAVGTGFALVENVLYLGTVDTVDLSFWLVRGFGPAILHGTLTGLFAILAKRLVRRDEATAWPKLCAALAGPIAVHAAFNAFWLPPVVATSVVLIALPLLVAVAFVRSERATRAWIGDGLDLDVELLGLVRSSDFGQTRLGRYLVALKRRFPGPVVADMFCLLQVELELAIRAKGLLMAREAGVDVPVAPDLEPMLKELDYLKRSIGPTGLLALMPLRVTSERDEWHADLLNRDRSSPRRRIASVVGWLRRRVARKRG